VSPSQGRHCSALLQEKLGTDFEVCSVVKPNDKLNEVVQDAHKLVKGLNDKDRLIVLGGTNDVEVDGKYIASVPGAIRKVLPLSKKTNDIFNLIPTRFDRVDLTSHVTNKRLIDSSTVKSIIVRIKKSSNMRLNFSNERLARDSYTRHGLHLIMKGKTLMFENCVTLF